MNSSANSPEVSWLKAPLQWWVSRFAKRQEQMLLFLSILIGALTGLVVVALILLTERLGMRLYPVGSPAWRRVLTPVVGSLAMGYVIYRFPLRKPTVVDDIHSVTVWTGDERYTAYPF